MPKLMAFLQKPRGRPRAVTLQHDVTPASMANARTFKVAKVACTESTLTAAYQIFAWQNPENNPILVTRVIFDVTGDATGAARVDIGVVDNAAATAADIFSAVDVEAAVATFDNLTALPDVHLVAAHGAATGAWITGRQTASANNTGFSGNVYIFYTEV